MGQIRIGVYDSDAGYTERFCQYMNGTAEDMEFVPLEDKEGLEALLASREAAAVLVPEEEKEEYPPFIGEIHVGYFTDRQEEEAGEVFRYQSRRNIRAAVEKLMELEDTSIRLLAFVGAGPGVGCSAAASAYARYLAAGEKRVLYINMNSLGDDTCIFRGGNQKDFGYLLAELKKGTAPATLLPSMLNRDSGGVYFFDNERIPLELMDAEEEQAAEFFRWLIDSGDYRYIIIDSSFSVNHVLAAACKAAERIFLTGDGTTASNHILGRIWELFAASEGNLLKKTSILYNRFSRQYGKYFENPDAPAAGCLELLAPAGAAQTVEELEKQEVLQGLMR